MVTERRSAVAPGRDALERDAVAGDALSAMPARVPLVGTAGAPPLDVLPEGGVAGDIETPRHRFVRRFKQQRVGMAALMFLIVLGLLSIFASWIVPHDPNAQSLGARLAPPSAEHWLGTDNLGRDLLSRMIYGGRTTLRAAFQAVGFGIVLGVPLGLIAGYVRGVFEAVVMRLTDAVMAFPGLLLVVAIAGVLGRGLTNAMLAVGILLAPRLLRLTRASVLSIREETYVNASRVIGSPSRKIIVKHVLPNALPPLLVELALSAGYVMLAEASLSFLGLGVQPPDTSWGAMIETAFPFMEDAPLFIAVPGIAIALTVLAFNLVGDALSASLGREDLRS